MTTQTPDPGVPPDYDPGQFPAFAVTVDMVILTMADGRLHVLLVQRGVAPFEGMWAIPGGFKRPTETLDEAAQRELAEETGVDAAGLLTQFGAYGDPVRDPRMNVVTVGYLAVLREVDDVVAGTDAAAAALVPVADALEGKSSSRSTTPGSSATRSSASASISSSPASPPRSSAPTFTLAELRAVYEAVWGVQLDGANFRRSVSRSTAGSSPPGAGPAGLGRRQAGGAVPRRPDVEARRPDQASAGRRAEKGAGMRAVVYDRYGPPEVLRLEDVERPVPGEDEVLVRIHATTVNRDGLRLSRRGGAVLQPLHLWRPPPKQRILGTEFAGEVEAVGRPSPSSRSATASSASPSSGRRTRRVHVHPRAQPDRAHAGRHELRGGGRVCDGAARADVPAEGGLSGREEDPHLRRVRVHRHGRRALAKHFGAHVTAVSSTKDLELVSSLGADEVIDYTQRRLHEERQDLRRRLRRRRQALVPARQALAESRRRLPPPTSAPVAARSSRSL